MIQELKTAIVRAIDTSGPEVYESFLVAARPVLLWLDHFERRGPYACDSLLTALRSVLAEACACMIAAMARPAIGALRAEIDVALSWLYYCDHPREWRTVNETAEGYRLKSELLRTFEQIDPAFKRRFSLLKARKTRREEDPYRLLSAHVHLQSEPVLPSLGRLSDIVQPTLSRQLCELQGEVSEYISDLCFSLYAGDWVALPEELTAPLRRRMVSADQYAEFVRS